MPGLFLSRRQSEQRSVRELCSKCGKREWDDKEYKPKNDTQECDHDWVLDADERIILCAADVERRHDQHLIYLGANCGPDATSGIRAFYSMEACQSAARAASTHFCFRATKPNDSEEYALSAHCDLVNRRNNVVSN